MSDEARAFWSKVARRYDAVVDAQIGPATRAMVRDRLSQERDLGCVVELGCGTGYYTPTLAERATRVVATDFAGGMVDLARERVRAPNVEFQVADCQQSGLPDAAFDTAFMSLLIHFTTPPETLREMRRILRPGGTLIIANLDVPALTGFDRVRCFVRIAYQGLLGYRTKPPQASLDDTLSQQQLRELLEGTGFAVVSTETFRDPSRSSNIPVEYVRAVRT